MVRSSAMNSFHSRGPPAASSSARTRSRWSDTLAPGILQRGRIVFSGHLPASVLQAALSFTQIFGPSGGSITVHHINLTPG